MESDLSKRNKLAQSRTFLANERTFLAYLRTAFGSFLFSVAIIKLFENSPWVFYLGILALVAGFFFLIFGIISYIRRNNRIKEF